MLTNHITTANAAIPPSAPMMVGMRGELEAADSALAVRGAVEGDKRMAVEGSRGHVFEPIPCAEHAAATTGEKRESTREGVEKTESSSAATADSFRAAVPEERMERDTSTSVSTVRGRRAGSLCRCRERGEVVESTS